MILKGLSIEKLDKQGSISEYDNYYFGRFRTKEKGDIKAYILNVMHQTFTMYRES